MRVIALKDSCFSGSLRGRLRSILGSAMGDFESERDRVSTLLMDVFRRTGNQEAYGLLFDLNQGRLRRTIGSRLRYLSLSVDASDILQEAFFNIYRYPYKFRSDRDSSFRVWVGAIVSNIIRRHLRRSFDRPHSVGQDGEGLPLDLPDLEHEPIQFAIEEESREGFAKVLSLFLVVYLECFRRLPPRDRHVLRLVELEGRKYREVGRLLGTRADNVKMLVFRARQRLFRFLSQRLEGIPSPSCQPTAEGAG